MRKLLPFLFLFLLMASGIIAQITPPNLVAPPNNATNVSLFPTFIWTSVSGATSYQLQVFQGGTPVLDQSGITGTQYTVVSAILQYGTQYYWRVRGIGGTQGPWSVQWYFTTQLTPLPPPVLLSPPNGQTNTPVTPTLNWQAVTGAQYYALQISLTSSFTTTVLNLSGLVNAGYVVPAGTLQNGTTYYWRVNVTGNGGTSDWSAPWNFVTIPAPPPPPNLVSPPNHATNIPTTTSVVWSQVTGATQYTVQVSLNNTFQSIVVNQDVTNPYYAIPYGVLSGQTQYFWRVLATNAGGSGNWSSVWDFTTGLAAPAAPLLLYPTNHNIGTPLSFTFSWTAVPGATSYRIQVSTNPNFTSTLINQVTGNQTQYTIGFGILQNNTTYYWRVNATNAGGTGAWSDVFDFTTLQSAPPPPSLIYPANNATTIPLTPTMQWSAVSSASSYRIQIALNNNFNPVVLDQTTPNNSFTVPSGFLIGNTNYYWRVASINAGGQGTYSAAWMFTTTQSLNLNLTVLLEGFYNGTTMVQDTVHVYLAQGSTPFTFKDSSNVLLSSNGNGLLSFAKASNGNYYIVVKHRNHLETWSTGTFFFSTGSTISYDFTTSANKAYGGNMKQVGSLWVLYGGDANGDGYIDPTDYTIFKTQFGKSGYIICDFNGDGFADGYDLPILYANFGKNLARPY